MQHKTGSENNEPLISCKT